MVAMGEPDPGREPHPRKFPYFLDKYFGEHSQEVRYFLWLRHGDLDSLDFPLQVTPTLYLEKYMLFFWQSITSPSITSAKIIPCVLCVLCV